MAAILTNAMGIRLTGLGHGLTLVRDTNAPDFTTATAVLRNGWREAAAEVDGYNAWWEAVADFIVPLPDEVLAVLTEKATGEEIDL